jgi:hypothetical protein
MRRRVILVTVAIAAIAVVAPGAYVAFLAAGMFYDASPYSFPQKVVAETRSPDRRFTAKILLDEPTKNYFFAIEGIDRTQLILSKTFVPNAGYHDPLVSVSWTNAETVTIVVDRDFGEANLRYEFNLRRLSFNQTDGPGSR